MRRFGLEPSVMGNVAWNLLGQVVPVAAGVVAIPVLVRAVGIERFGVLTIAWAFVGYFSVFDLGVGRAITKLVAERLGSDERAIPSIVWTGIALMACLGAAMTLCGLVAAPALAQRVLSVPRPLVPETLATLRILSLAIPVVIVSIALRGVIEATQRFRGISLVRIVSGFATFGAPLAVVPFTHDLGWIVGVLVSLRVPFLAIYLVMSLRSIPALRHPTLDLVAVRPLLGFGAWITVGNVVGPLLQYLDRFLIAGLASLSAVAYYTTPFDMASKLLVVPIAAMGVLFPAFAATARRERRRAIDLLLRAEVGLLASLYPIVLVGVVAAPDALRLWLGPEFARHSTLVLQVVLIGVLVNSLAPAPFALLQASGRPYLTGVLSLVELPCYALALWLLLSWLGIVGAALAWTLRVTVELLATLVLAGRYLSLPAKRSVGLTAALVVALVSLVIPIGMGAPAARAAFLVVALTGSLILLLRWSRRPRGFAGLGIAGDG